MTCHLLSGMRRPRTGHPTPGSGIKLPLKFPVMAPVTKGLCIKVNKLSDLVVVRLTEREPD